MEPGRLAQPRFHLPPGEDFLLLPPTQQPYAYANVDRLFATRAILRGPTTRALPPGPELTLDADGYMARNQVAGLLVLRQGQLVLERYALGLAEATRWTTMSMVKSMTSTLVGVALAEGRLPSLEAKVSAHLPALAGSAYDTVTVRHLLTMSSGVRWNEDYTDRNSDVNRYSKSLGDKVPGGVLALMRTLPAEAPPGNRFNYCTGDTYVLGSLVSAVMQEPLATTMSRALWQPLGMEFDAFYTLESEGGQEIGGSRAGMALRDLGRFGQFMLEGGVIAGRRVLPEGWVTEAGRRHFALDPAGAGQGNDGYGYSWWITPEGAMMAVGFAGQSLYVNRAAGVVVVTLSCWPQPPFDKPYARDFGAARSAFHQAVLEACR